MERADRTFFMWNAAVSTVAVAIIGYILGRDAAPGGSIDLSFVPALNATCNALASVCLVSGWVAIRRKAVQFHRLCMVTALAMSAIFLVGYLAYHYVHGDTKYQGTGPMRAVYLIVLASHVILSMAVVPLSLTAFYFAFKRAFDKHKKVTRWALPIWLYVSVTGVVVYWMLYQMRF